MAYLFFFLVLIVAFVWFTGWYGIAIVLLALIIFAFLTKNDSKELKKENKVNRIKKEHDDRVTKIAEFFLKNNIDENKIEVAKDVISLHETKIEHLHSTLKNKENQYLDEKNSFFSPLFDSNNHESKLREYQKECTSISKSIKTYETRNKSKYEASLNLLKSFDFSFYEKNKAEIKKKMIDIKQLEEKKQHDSKEEKIRNLREKSIKDCEMVQKERLIEEKQKEYEYKTKKVLRSIDEINGFMVPLKNQVIKKQTLESQVFKILEDNLDIVLNNVDYMNSMDLKKIERIKAKIEDIFSKENSGHFDVDKNQIIDLLSQIIEAINKKNVPESQKESKHWVRSIKTFFS